MLYKLIVIIILLILFYLLMSNNIETFVDNYDYDKNNDKNKNNYDINGKNYINKNEYPIDRLDINSSIPYDIIIKNDKNQLYDYGNDEINEKLAKICEIDNIKIIKMTEGIKWSKWYKPNTYVNDYYNKFILFFKDIIEDEIFDLPDDNNKDDKYDIYQHKFMKYKFNVNSSKTLLLNVELIIYRKNRPLAKHLKILVITNGIYYNIILAKVIGVIKECDLNKNNIDTYNNINSNYYEYKINDDYDERYISKFKLNYDMNSFLFDNNEKLEHSRIEYNMYNKLFKDL